MFKRKIYERLKAWKQESQGKTALMIEGARRVGKSTVVEEFHFYLILFRHSLARTHPVIRSPVFWNMSGRTLFWT